MEAVPGYNLQGSPGHCSALGSLPAVGPEPVAAWQCPQTCAPCVACEEGAAQVESGRLLPHGRTAHPYPAPFRYFLRLPLPCAHLLLSCWQRERLNSLKSVWGALQGPGWR